MGDCIHCGRSAGWFRSKHQECARAYQEAWRTLVAAATESAREADFDAERLRQRLHAIAEQTLVPAERIDAAIAEAWGKAVLESLADGVLTKDEESRLREFRDEFALQGKSIDKASGQIADASHDRLLLLARQTALSGSADEFAELAAHMDDSVLTPAAQRQALLKGWEAATEEALEDHMLTVDEEGALLRYAKHFGFEVPELDRGGAYQDLAKGAILREVAEGIVPDRPNLFGQVPFNLQKSEKLVWVVHDVEYLETRVRRMRQGQSHGLSIRITKGLYYRPSTFRSEAIEREETNLVDVGLLGFTNKHVYFHGARKRFRIRYDKIVSFEPYNDGLGLMRDAQSAKPQTFVTGDGWFVYNLATNLAQLPG